MSGNAVTVKTGVESVRMDVDTYNRVKSEVFAILDSLNVTYLDIPYVKEKQDFGDLDIIVIDCNIMEHIDKFNVNDNFVNNKPVVSILYEGKYQVDFIKSNMQNAFYMQKYLSYNDLGNLIGRMVRPFELVHSIEGLYFKKDMIGYSIKELISLDYRKVLEILKLDVDTFDNGFDTFNDMFDYVTSSPYFDYSRFLFDNLNNRNRVRDKKRKVYNMFLEYINSKTFKEPLFYNVYDHYPVLKHIVVKTSNQQAYNKALRNAIDVNVVMQITSLKNKELGDFIALMKETYNEKLLTMTSQEKISAIKELYETF